MYWNKSNKTNNIINPNIVLTANFKVYKKVNRIEKRRADECCN